MGGRYGAGQEGGAGVQGYPVGRMPQFHLPAASAAPVPMPPTPNAIPGAGNGSYTGVTVNPMNWLNAALNGHNNA